MNQNLWGIYPSKTPFPRLPDWDGKSNLFEFCMKAVEDVRLREAKGQQPLQGRKL